MIKIQVTDTKVTAIRGISSKNGKPYEFFKQVAYAFLPGVAYPEKIELSLDADKPYAAGDYQLDPTSIYVDRNNRLQVQPVLIRIAAPAAVPADKKPAA